MKVLFKNATVLTLNEKNDILLNTDVLVIDDKIKKIEKNISSNLKECVVVDCTNKLLMPGFVNSFSQSAFDLNNTMSSNINLNNTKSNAKLAKTDTKPYTKICDDEYYNNAVLAYSEMLKNGITTTFDFCLKPELNALAMKNTKIRGVLGIDAVKENEVLSDKNLIKKFNSLKEINSNINFVLYLKNIYDYGEDVFFKLHNYSKNHDLVLCASCSETLSEVGETDTKYGATPIGLLESYGFLDTKCMLIQCVYCDKEDVEILKNYDVSIATCPSSNLISGSGIAPVYSFVKNNINVCLGTDGREFENNLNIIKEMFLVRNLQSGILNQPDAISSIDVLKMATQNGAKALGLNNIGAIKPDYFADIVLLDLSVLNIKNNEKITNFVTDLLESKNVCLTMVNGDIVYNNVNQI